MSADGVTYIDSSAIVKLIVREAETEALRTHLAGRERLVSSALAKAEVMRAVLPLGSATRSRARDVLAVLGFVRISDRVIAEAGELEPASLRTLDAIHVATAGLFGDTLVDLITYDERMASSALALGMPVTAPN